MKRGESIFHSPFLSRFSNRTVFFLLSIVFVGGLFLGVITVKLFSLLDGQLVLPTFFSGVSLPNSGFLSCFSSILLNGLIALILLFLFGVTAFGAFAIPVFLFFKAASIGIGVLSFLNGQGIEALTYPALCYTPVAAASALMLLLFATRALLFSNGLARAGFSQNHDSLNFQLYFQDFLYFLCFTVILSIFGGFFAWLFDMLL